MDDIMILFHKVVTDLTAFNETQFGIFNETEQPVLKRMFAEECDGSSSKFLSLLSPEQKQRVALWACRRSSFSVDELVSALKKFTKYLESVSYAVYPVTAQQPTVKKKKKRLSVLITKR